MKLRRSLSISLQILTLGFISLLAYQNCSPGALNSKSSASSSSFSDCGTSICDVIDTNTVAVANSQNVMVGMLAKVGIAQPSNATKNAFANQKTKLPEVGSVTQITAPTWMAIATMSSEVCNDLINQETVAGAPRRIFNTVDFTKGPSTFTDVASNDVIRRMARNFWARNETGQELSFIKSSLNDSFSGTAAADTRKEMLYLCTAMLSSTDAQTY